MAKDDEKLIIEIELDDGKLAKGFVKAEKVAEKSGKKAGREFGDGAAKSADKGLSNLSSRMMGLAAALAATVGVREVIAASSRQQAAVNNLESSLRSIGRYTPELSKELQNYASELQRSTRFGDEATLEQIAFAQAMGANVEQSKAIVAAAQDMATALNIDFNSAVRNITKTLGGYAGELGEVIPELKNLSQEQLRAGDGVSLLARKYQGFANRDLANFDAKLEQTKNTFGDFLEVLGDFVTKSDSSVGFMSDMNIALSGLTATLKEYIGAGGESQLNEEIENTKGQIAGLEEQIASAKEGNEGWLNAIFGGPDIELMNGRLEGLKSRLAELQEQKRALASEGEDGGGNQVIQDKELDNLRLAQEEYDKLIAKYTEMGYSAQFAKQIIADPAWQENVLASNRQLSLSFSDLSKSLKAEAGKIRITSGQIAATMLNGIGNGAGQAFAAFGKAIAEGQNGLEAFLNSFLSSMGQMAIQVGTQFMLQGVAYQLAGMPNGGALIAAGAALAAFGGAMSAVFDGKGSETSTAGAGYNVGNDGSIDRFDDDDAALDEDSAERVAGSSVNVTIQGNVLDGDESGLRILEMINKSIKEQGAALA